MDNHRQTKRMFNKKGSSQVERTDPGLLTRRHIMDAGVKVISERGYAGTTTTLIAKRAGVSQGSIFHHFGTKAKLISCIIQSQMGEFVQRLRERIRDEDDPLKQLEEVGTIYSEMGEQMGSITGVIATLSKPTGLTMEEMRNQGLLDLGQLLEVIIERGIRQGKIRRIDPWIVVVSLIGVVNHTVLRWHMMGKNFSLEEAVKTAVNIVVEGLRSR